MDVGWATTSMVPFRVHLRNKKQSLEGGPDAWRPPPTRSQVLLPCFKRCIPNSPLRQIISTYLNRWTHEVGFRFLPCVHKPSLYAYSSRDSVRLAQRLMAPLAQMCMRIRQGLTSVDARDAIGTHTMCRVADVGTPCTSSQVPELSHAIRQVPRPLSWNSINLVSPSRTICKGEQSRDINCTITACNIK